MGNSTGKYAATTSSGLATPDHFADSGSVLIVDDDPVFAWIPEKILTNAGYRVFKAETGTAGLDSIRRMRPHLVLLDVMLPDGSGASWKMLPKEANGGAAALTAMDASHQAGEPFGLVLIDMHMPDMDGAALGSAVKADQRFSDIALILITALGAPGDARRFAELGFAAFLNKPVRQSELLDTILFVLNNPRVKSAKNPIVTRHMARERLRRSLPRPSFSGKVLVVDDNQVNQQVALGILQKMGLDVATASNGREALEALSSTKFNLVFMDVQMPEMDRLEATKLIRSQESENESREPEIRGRISDVGRIPIIAMTAGAMQHDREMCLEAGMDDYVAKPVNPSTLANIMEKFLPVSPGRPDGNDSVRRDAASTPWQSTPPPDSGQTPHGENLPIFD
ncbi:response regulator [Desulfonatronum parangueonense]